MSYATDAKVISANMHMKEQIAKERPSMETAIDRLRNTIDRADARFAECTARCERILRDPTPSAGANVKQDSMSSGDSSYVRAIDSASYSVEALIDRMVDFCYRLET